MFLMYARLAESSSAPRIGRRNFWGGKFGAEASAVLTARALRFVGEIGFDFAIDPSRNVHNAIDDLRAAREIVFFFDGVRLKPGSELFGIIEVHSRHPASGFDDLSGHIMVGIFLVNSPGIVANDGVDLQKTNEMDKARAHFHAGDFVHLMIAIFEVENLL